MEYILFIILGLILVFVFYLAINNNGKTIDVGDMMEVESADEIEDSNVVDNKIESLAEITNDPSTDDYEMVDEYGVSRFRARRGMDTRLATSNMNTDINTNMDMNTNINQNTNSNNQDVI